MKRRTHRKASGTYGPLAELLASPIAPMPKALRVHQLTRMWQGLAAIETAPQPTTDDWRVCSDAVNLMETLVAMGELEDHSGLLLDAVAALAMAGKRHTAGGAIRMDGKGIQATRAVLEDYAQALDALPHRTMVRCHRFTEKRLREILAGHKRPHDIEITVL
jgi:hypothetical protein